MKKRKGRWFLSGSKKQYRILCDEDAELHSLQMELKSLQDEIDILNPLIFSKTFYELSGGEHRDRYKEVSDKIWNIRREIQEREAVLKLICGLGVKNENL
jgi:hypothetical protein